MTEFRRAVEALGTEGPAAAGPAIVSGAPRASAEDIARLAEVLAKSGAIIDEPAAERVDIASTGGPGSLTTLLAPLVAASGAQVSKIGVPGRPAGGIDTLGSIPGFEAELEPSDAKAALRSCGYLHTIAGSHFCPLDAAFFAWRKANGAQAIPVLAIASLLSKKLAAGVGRVVLDIRVGPHGNFGPDFDAASDNAHRFIEVASILGIEAICTLGGVADIAQPYIGRGEALTALDLAVTGAATGWLRRHVHYCLTLASLALGREVLPRDSMLAAAAQRHESMLYAHGVKLHDYRAHVAGVQRVNRVDIAVRDHGFLAIDIEGVRQVLVDRQSNMSLRTRDRFPDPCGLILKANINEEVAPGDIIATARDQGDPWGLAQSLMAFVSTIDTPSIRPFDNTMRIIR